MKSIKVKELMTWLESKTRKIDKPRDFDYDEVLKLIEISEIEQNGEIELLEKKVKEFKSNYEYSKPI
jgi:hypothetical protein